MKKEQHFQLTIKTSPAIQNRRAYLFGFFCSFLLFFFACGSFLLNFCLIFSPDFSFPSMAGLCTLFGLSGALLFSLRKNSSFALLFLAAWGILLLALFLLREDFFRQFFSAAGAVEKLVNAVYGLRLFPGYQDIAKDKWILCFFFTAFYLFVLFLTMLWKKRILFVLLLGVPILCSYLLEVNMPLMLFALPLGAFLLWRGAVSPQSVSRLWLLTVPLQGILFLAAAWLFTPMVSPWLFQSSEAFSDRINAVGNQLLFGEGSTPSVSSAQRDETATSGFSYEPQTDSQSITSNPPVYTSQTVLSIELSETVSQTLYLRGFVGADYESFQWNPPGDEEWFTYAQSMGFSRQQAQDIYSLSVFAVSAENVLELSMDFPSAPAFTYLPLAGQGDSISLSESNRLSGRSSQRVTGQVFPLTLDTMGMVSLENFSQSSRGLVNAYESFCRSRYTSWDENEMGSVLKELNQLPVYSSMPEIPTDQDIQNAAEEIQNFLWSHATYSLALEPFSSDTPLAQEILYEQRAGFCIHFATVGAQLFRMYGIPARYVSGYAVLPDSLSEDGQGNFIGEVRDSRAHAWVEIYMQNAGWVPVEVTPGSSFSAPETTPTPEETPEESPSPKNNPEEPASDAGNGSKNASLLGTAAKIIKGLLFSALFLGIIFLVLLFIHRLLFRFRLGYYAGNPTQAYLTVFKNLIKLWELEFSIKIENPLEREYFRLLSEKLPESQKKDFTSLYAEAEALAYGQEKTTPKKLRNLRRFYLAQRKNYLSGKKGPEKLRILLINLFL